MNIVNKLWFVFFLTFPLAGFDIIRFNLGYFQIPIFIIILFLVVVSHYSWVCIEGGNLGITFHRSDNIFLIMFIMLIILHLLNLIRSIDVESAITEQVKLVIAFMVFLSILIIFPKNLVFIRKSITIISISSTALLMIYIYHHYFTLEAPYLAIQWDTVTRYGKNQLGLYLAITTPLVLWRYISGRLISIWIIPIAVHTFALIYTQSRGAWVSFLLSLIAVLLISAREITKKKYIQSISVVAGLSVILGGVAFIYYSDSIHFSVNVKQRVESILGNNYLSADRSISLRKHLIKKSINQFYENPIFGIGSYNFREMDRYNTHNDYLRIMVEQGMIGIAPFIFMVIIIIQNVFKNRGNSWEIMGLKQSCIVIILYMNFINAYNLSVIYVIYALLLSLKYSDFRENLANYPTPPGRR